MTKFFTSEAVSCGHPDKVADQISDAILDLILAEDPHAKVAIETLVTGNNVILSGEVKSSVEIGQELIDRVVRETISEIGYTSIRDPFNAFTVNISSCIQEQSRNLSRINSSEEVFAGDQGMVFGYASNESPDMLPIQLSIAKQIILILDHLRRYDPDLSPILGPDAKTLVTVSTSDNGKSFILNNIVVSTQHYCALPILYDLKPYLYQNILDILKIRYANFPISFELFDTPEGIEFFKLNAAGEFIEGGPVADTGLTGRKIVVDTYGGAVPHGGGAFSGKDPSKVDRSGALLARHIAKTLVAYEMCDKCLVSLSYEIGQQMPSCISIDSFGTSKQSVDGKDPDEFLVDWVMEHFGSELNINNFINSRGLKTPIYKAQASYGLSPFGVDSAFLPKYKQTLKGDYIGVVPFSWEIIDPKTVVTEKEELESI